MCVVGDWLFLCIYIIQCWRWYTSLWQPILLYPPSAVLPFSHIKSPILEGAANDPCKLIISSNVTRKPLQLLALFQTILNMLHKVYNLATTWPPWPKPCLLPYDLCINEFWVPWQRSDTGWQFFGSSESFSGFSKAAILACLHNFRTLNKAIQLFINCRSHSRVWGPSCFIRFVLMTSNLLLYSFS